MDDTIKRIIFVPRTTQDINDHPDDKILGLSKSLEDALKRGWGKDTKLWTLDNKEKHFDIGYGDQLYVIGGHGEPGSGVVFWGDKSNTLTAETVAERTAAKFPHFNKLPAGDGYGIKIKIYSCHSAEGGYNSFASRFARAFRPVGITYEVTIFGYWGKVTPRALKLNDANVLTSKQVEKFRAEYTPKGMMPAGYTGPKESVKKDADHRWSKINGGMFHCRASEARDMVYWVRKITW
jgi:hypothetical protein